MNTIIYTTGYGKQSNGIIHRATQLEHELTHVMLRHDVIRTAAPLRHHASISTTSSLDITLKHNESRLSSRQVTLTDVSLRHANRRISVSRQPTFLCVASNVHRAICVSPICARLIRAREICRSESRHSHLIAPPHFMRHRITL